VPLGVLAPVAADGDLGVVLGVEVVRYWL